MKTSASRVERIQFLTKTKRYSAPIAHQLKSSARKTLSAGAYKTWDLLRDMAAFDTKSYSIKISQETIAKELDCTVKTIGRHVSEIKQAGFIKVKYNINKLNVTEACTYYIDFPEPVYVLAEAEKDRISAPTTTSDTIPVASYKTMDFRQATLPYSHPAIFVDRPDSIVHNHPDKNVVHINNQINNKNNNAVVDFSFMNTEQDQELEETHERLTILLTQCNNQKQETEKQLFGLSPSVAVEDHISKLKKIITTNEKPFFEVNNEKQQLNEKIVQLNQQTEVIKRELELVSTKLDKQQKEKHLNHNPSYTNKLLGDRQFSTYEINSMLEKLQNCGVGRGHLNRLANEIVFEARFGSLVKNSQTKEENSIQRCINIGCKLVKAGQWSTPSNFMKVLAH